MAKMYFRYAAMGGGKTLHLLQVVNNYERIGKSCLVAKPSIDDKAQDKVQTRLGLERKCDFLIDDNFSLDNIINQIIKCDCLVVDEAQFLSKEQTWMLYEIAKNYDIPVICYGLRSRVNGEPFIGSQTLLTIADDIEEIKSICKCGKKATFQVRYINEELDIGNEEIVIDKPENNVRYEALCGNCYINLRNKQKILKKVNNN